MTGISEKPLRILHTPVDLGGHARAMAAAQRTLGHDALSTSLAWSPFGFNGDECFDRPIGARARLLGREMGRYRLLWRSLVWADVIHCHFGQTLCSVRQLPLPDPAGGRADPLVAAYSRLIWLKDLMLWRAAGKRVVMTFYGDDVRQVGVALSRARWTHLAAPELRAQMEPRDALKAEMVRRLHRAGVRLFAVNPDLLAVLPQDAEFLPYGHVDPERYVLRLPAEDGPLRLAHMPTHRDIKGTSLFLSAVETLRREGHAVELTLVEGKPNDEALRILATHDVLLDQLRVGWFGGVAVEAMAMGKPVMVWLNPADVELTPAEYARNLPCLQADPSTVLQALRALVMMSRAKLRDLGLASRAFVKKWHSPAVVARRVLAAYHI